MGLDISSSALSGAIDAAVWALRVSEQRGGPATDDHLAELRLHMLRARRRPWRPSRRREVELAISVVRSRFDGSEVVVPRGDDRLTARLIVDLLQLERAVRHALPSGVAA